MDCQIQVKCLLLGCLFLAKHIRLKNSDNLKGLKSILKIKRYSLSKWSIHLTEFWYKTVEKWRSTLWVALEKALLLWYCHTTCVCVCVCERERERERYKDILSRLKNVIFRFFDLFEKESGDIEGSIKGSTKFFLQCKKVFFVQIRGCALCIVVGFSLAKIWRLIDL